ncbi:MAG: ATPase, T2SS/T4P/T4SS family [Peptostreptococcaceae bacterium]|nr:ATPase, T2SS/T4P/T4SS family [Peptostreptococcaceae bacterium]
MLIYGVNSIFEENRARELRAIPSHYEGDVLQVLYDGSTEQGETISETLKDRGTKAIKLHPISQQEIDRLLNTYYSIELKEPEIFEQIRTFIREEQFERLFLYVVRKAKGFGASDIHLFRENAYLIVRFRIKGVLKTFCILDGSLLSILGRIVKVKGNVDISRSLRPIDTRLDLELEGKTLDIRVSIVNTLQGEKFSLRLLSDENVPHSLEELGLKKSSVDRIKAELMKESGAIVITGPTGSGKSTTVRCFLREINQGLKHIVSIEDPVEYQMEGVTQIQVDDREGSRFSDGVRSVLRQDPDILFIGEIRDEVSAEIAMKASITGHLVFTTLHTRSASLAIERLENLGVDRHLLIHAISMIINQRLVGELCPHCKREERYAGETIEALGLKAGDPIACSDGCVHCDYSGISKLVPVMSILSMDERTKKIYLQQGDIAEEGIREAVAEKFKSREISLTEARKFL